MRAVGRWEKKRFGPSSIGTSTTSTGPEMELPVQERMHYFDLYHGVELTPERRGDEACADIFDRGQGLRRGARH